MLKLIKKGKQSFSIHQFAKFATVGLVALIIDVALFNIFLMALTVNPFLAKALSTTIAIVVSFLGNKYWSFKHPTEIRMDAGSAAVLPPLSDLPEEEAVLGVSTQFAIFVAVNISALLFPLATLYISRNMLGNDSVVADNVAANGVGLVLATVFRFYAYKFWVFKNPASVQAS